MKLRLYVTVLGAVLAVAGCSSEEDGDETGTGGTGTGGGGVGATGGTGVGATGGEGVGATGGTGVGGGGGSGDCFTCAAYITDCVAPETPEPACETQDTCPGDSTDLFNALADCACTECEVECPNVCAGMPGEDPECGACQMGAIGGACSAEFGACSGDA